MGEIEPEEKQAEQRKLEGSSVSSMRDKNVEPTKRATVRDVATQEEPRCRRSEGQTEEVVGSSGDLREREKRVMETGENRFSVITGGRECFFPNSRVRSYNDSTVSLH